MGIGAFFKISDIQVQGNVLYSKEEIIEASGIELGDNLIITDKNAAAEKILESKNYIDTVIIRKRFPGTVSLEIIESRLLGYFEYGGKYYVINKKCEILSTGDAASVAGYILIRGIEPLKPEIGKELELGENDAAKKQYISDIMQQLSDKELFGRVQWIDASNIASVKFLYKGNITVELGRNEAIEKKFDMLVRMLEDISDTEKGTINLATVGEGHYIPN